LDVNKEVNKLNKYEERNTRRRKWKKKGVEKEESRKWEKRGGKKASPEQGLLITA
jgi:hypothetical protein